MATEAGKSVSTSCGRTSRTVGSAGTAADEEREPEALVARVEAAQRLRSLANITGAIVAALDDLAVCQHMAGSQQHADRTRTHACGTRLEQHVDRRLVQADLGTIADHCALPCINGASAKLTPAVALTR